MPSMDWKFVLARCCATSKLKSEGTNPLLSASARASGEARSTPSTRVKSTPKL
eukprot:CAMPEP_0183564684 /NCGR_PEP_ID=MMETSP0371-20130417/106269_1 /TAXON_ID=268820 /ORGANISM="Peridinium aciculiferum, Strain PAER-2" /LENGTH=52 /DNA_ID=CAMNT_0025773735 /DNA_START=365 /DNA_END=523 /DNA_ORIENTATION=+